MALDMPLIFDQLWWDWELAMQADEEAGWKKPGEKAEDARDRLKAERAKAKQEIASRLASMENATDVHDRGTES